MPAKKLLLRGVLAVLLLMTLCTAVNAEPVLLSNVPDYAWYNGCAPTSATMMMGYYDINGYQGLSYSNLIPGGVAPLSTFVGSSSLVTSAINAMAADMGTTSLGSTSVWYYLNGARYTAQDFLQDAPGGGDTAYGLWKYVNDAGYQNLMANVFNQLIYSSTASLGFTYADFIASINAGMPVLIEIKNSTQGHAMLGYGYDAASNTVYVRDTWASGGYYNGGAMSWGGTYNGMTMFAVTGLIPQGGSPIPLPSAIFLLGPGLACLIGIKRKYLG